LADSRYGGVAAGVGRTYNSDFPSITPNEWHCVAVAYKDEEYEATVYYDGLTQTITETALGPGYQFVSMGGHSNFDDDYMDGIVDEVFFFDRYLSAAEISTVCSELSGDSTLDDVRVLMQIV